MQRGLFVCVCVCMCIYVCVVYCVLRICFVAVNFLTPHISVEGEGLGQRGKRNASGGGTRGEKARSKKVC